MSYWPDLMSPDLLGKGSKTTRKAGIIYSWTSRQLKKGSMYVADFFLLIDCQINVMVSSFPEIEQKVL